MFNSKREDSILVKTDTDYSFFDFCGQNDLTVEVTHTVGTKIEKVQGCVTGYFPELSMFALKGHQGADCVIPIKNVELITIAHKP